MISIGDQLLLRFYDSSIDCTDLWTFQLHICNQKLLSSYLIAPTFVAEVVFRVSLINRKDFLIDDIAIIIRYEDFVRFYIGTLELGIDF